MQVFNKLIRSLTVIVIENLPALIFYGKGRASENVVNSVGDKSRNSSYLVIKFAEIRILNISFYYVVLRNETVSEPDGILGGNGNLVFSENKAEIIVLGNNGIVFQIQKT